MTPFADPLQLATAALSALSKHDLDLAFGRNFEFEVGRGERIRPGPLLASTKVTVYVLQEDEA